MAADEVSAGRLTVFQALQFDDSLYLQFMALHEAGHAIVALATGEASVSECVISPTETEHGAMAEAYTDASWDSAAAYHALLYGGVVVQQRWLHEQQLWSPLRESAVQTLASHDYEALMATGATADQLRQARNTALDLSDRYWPAILAASELLDHNGRITGDELEALLRRHPATTHAAPTLTAEQTAQARAIRAASKERSRQLTTQTPAPGQPPRQQDPSSLPDANRLPHTYR